MSRWGKASRGWVKAARRNVRYSRKHFCYRRLAVFGLGSFGAGVGRDGGRSAPCLVGATWRGCDPLVPDSHLGPFCRRFRSLFLPECGKDSAGGAARKGFRAERPGKDSGPSGLGLFGRREFLGCWLPAFGPEGVGLQIPKSGQGSFQQSAISSQSSVRQGTEHRGCSAMGGWSGAAANCGCA